MTRAYLGTWDLEEGSEESAWGALELVLDFQLPPFPSGAGAVGKGNRGEVNKCLCLFRHYLGAASAESKKLEWPSR